MSPTHPQVLPPKSPAMQPGSQMNYCALVSCCNWHSFSPFQSSHCSFECKLLMALTAWLSIWNTLVPVQHHKHVRRLRKNMDIRSYLFMFIFLLFVFTYSSFLLKFYSCQLVHRIRAKSHPCRVSLLLLHFSQLLLMSRTQMGWVRRMGSTSPSPSTLVTDLSLFQTVAHLCVITLKVPPSIWNFEYCGYISQCRLYHWQMKIVLWFLDPTQMLLISSIIICN